MKTTKEERIFKMVKDFIRIHKGNMVDAQKIFDTVISSNPYLSNSKLTTDERTFISEQVKKASV